MVLCLLLVIIAVIVGILLGILISQSMIAQWLRYTMLVFLGSSKEEAKPR